MGELPVEQQDVLQGTRLKVAPKGMAIAGVPVDIQQYQRRFLLEAMQGEPAALMQALEPIGNYHATHTILLKTFLVNGQERCRVMHDRET